MKESNTLVGNDSLKREVFLTTKGMYMKESNTLAGNNSLIYQPSGEGGTHSLPATPYRLENPKWPPGVPRFLGILSNFAK